LRWEALKGGIRIAAHPTVSMLFVSNNEQEEKESRLFWSGLGFGISIPIIVSGVAEIIKDPVVTVALRVRNTKKH
jgi:hypothetical protein